MQMQVEGDRTSKFIENIIGVQVLGRGKPFTE